jgi:hypothetical protein
MAKGNKKGIRSFTGYRSFKCFIAFILCLPVSDLDKLTPIFV